MFASWSIGIHIRTFTNIGGFSSVVRGATLADERVKSLNRSQRALNETMKMGSGIVALASMGAMYAGIKGAADLQTAMVGVQTATQATGKEMDRLRQKAFDVSAATAQSVTDSANVLKVLGRSGFSASQVETLAIPAAKFADIQYLSRGVSFEEGANQAATLAHMFRRYGTDAAPIFDMSAALSKMMPDGLNKAITQMSYFVPTFKSLGVSDEDSFATMAILSRTGYGKGKGGTGMANLLMDSLGPMQQTNFAQKGKKHLLNQWGILDSTGHNRFFHQTADNVHLKSKDEMDAMTPEQLGTYAKSLAGKVSFDFIGMLKEIAMHSITPESRKLGQDKLTSQLISMFGKQGGRMALLALDPQFIDQITKAQERLKKSMKGKGAVEEMQAKYMDTFWGRWKQATTNVDSLLTDSFGSWLGPLKSLATVIGDGAHAIQAAVHQHRWLGNAISVGIAAIGVASGLAFLALGRMGIAMAALPAALDNVSAAMLRMGIAAETAGGEIAAGEAATKVGAVGVVVGAASTAAVFGGPLALHMAAAQEGNRRSIAGTNATEAAQFRNFKRYDHDGLRTPFGSYDILGHRISSDTLSKINQYNKAGSQIHAPVHGAAGANRHQVGHTVNVTVHPGASSGNPAQDNRHALNVARKTAQKVAMVLGADIRTTGRAAGGTINAWGMSNFELAGATG